jgi:Tfp pilus assembly protein PilF
LAPLMNKSWLAILICILLPLTSCQEEQQVPMWEGIQKTEEQLKADQIFIAETEKVIGKEAGAQRALQVGWEFLLEKNDPNMAIRRFNQAWLLDKSNPNIHWGYAVATHRQGLPLEVVSRHFSSAEDGFSQNMAAVADIYADFGRVLAERHQLDLAKDKLKKALAMNHKHKSANVTMASILASEGNHALAAEHLEAAK